MAYKFDKTILRKALGKFATGVTVVTAKGSGGQYVGVTVNSFSSVSLEPPLVLWSLHKDAYSLPIFTDCQHFVVNVLASDQKDISNRFATRGVGDKFGDIAYCLGNDGIPVLQGCTATFECRKAYTYEGGDHLIFVGEVIEFVSCQKQALAFLNGVYAVPEPLPALRTPANDSPETEGFVFDYLDYLLSHTAHSFQQHFNPILAASGVSRYEWRILCYLNDNRTGVTFEELSAEALIEFEELQDLIARLVEKQWISIDTVQSEEKKYYLTPEGEGITVPIIIVARAHESYVSGKLSKISMNTLKSSLKELITELSKERYQPPTTLSS